MAIPRISSQGFNNILEEATEKIDRSIEKIDHIKKNTQKTLQIMNNEIDFMNYELSLSRFHESLYGDYVTSENIVAGIYESYREIAHCKLKKKSYDILNLEAINDNAPYFRDEVSVKINGIENISFNNILKNNRVTDKELYFEEFEEDLNEIKIEIERDAKKAVGNSRFNMIEFNPYLQGSFDITSIEIYDNDMVTPSVIIGNIHKVGKTRFILDKKYLFSKVVFSIKPNYKKVINEKKLTPFGLDTILFKECDFRNDSYLILEFNSDKFIDDIVDEAVIYTSTKPIDVSLNSIGAEIYLEYNNSILENRQLTSTNVKNSISRNVKKIFIKLPIGNFINTDSINDNTFIAMKLDINKR